MFRKETNSIPSNRSSLAQSSSSTLQKDIDFLLDCLSSGRALTIEIFQSVSAPIKLKAAPRTEVVDTNCCGERMFHRLETYQFRQQAPKRKRHTPKKLKREKRQYWSESEFNDMRA